jgi:hypothetical protein
MKTILTTILLSLTVLVQGQRVSIIAENNINGINSIGLQLNNKNGFGVYVVTGSNSVMRYLGVNQHYKSKVDGKFTSTVSWYDKNGSYYPVMSGPMFTNPEYGNRLLETGYCKNIVETTDQWTTEKHSVTSAGVVIPIKNVKVRVGVGLHREIITGTKKYHKWTHDFTVRKYKDEWGAVPGGVHVVESTGSTSTYNRVDPINVDRLIPNGNFSVLIPFAQNTDFSIGLDTHNSINFGFTYNIK